MSNISKRSQSKTPELLVAHAYTRYMGDLSGGQILKNIAKRAMGLKNGDGTAFYEFEKIKNHGAFKKEYRAALDTLPVDDATQDRIVEEAKLCLSFKYGNVPRTKRQLVCGFIANVLELAS